jgi:GDP-mannose 6-dehydrogenase
MGHQVIGVDINADKVTSINQQSSPVIEPGLNELIEAGVQSGCLRATLDVSEAISASEIALICVGTPSSAHGNLDFDPLHRVCVEIAQALRGCRDAYKVVTFRSTLLPGTLSSDLLPILSQQSGRLAGQDFGMAVNPEFLREGSAITDFLNPTFTLIGEIDERSGDLLADLYKPIPAPIHRMSPDEACMVKYASNAFHALKVTFANEMGQLCKMSGVDSHRVMKVFCEDTRLNISPRYLRPGFAFGGSCLPKDLRALLYLARHNDLQLPVLEAVLPSNHLLVEKAAEMILSDSRKTVGIIGLSFKPDTDDLRESPMVELVEILTGKGLQVRIFDDNIILSRLMGGNKAYIDRVIPHISGLLQPTLEEVVNHSGIIVLSHDLQEDQRRLMHLLKPDQLLIDLVKVPSDGQSRLFTYEGISW